MEGKKEIIHINIKELHPYEAFVIHQWRTKYRFARFEVVTQNGIPQGIEKGISRDDPRNYRIIIKEENKKT